MRILGLETSLPQGSIAVLEDDSSGVNVIREIELPQAKRAAQTLLPALSELLGDCHWQPGDIDLISVTTGPGSFTGLRIGVTTAKTLAFAVKAPVVGLNTLAVIAAKAPSERGNLWAVMDAQRGELFATCLEGNNISLLPEVRILSVDDWLAKLCPGDRVMGKPLKQLVERLPEGVTTVPDKYWHPRAGVVGQLGYDAFLKGMSVDPMQLVPNYYRKSAAEEKLAGR